MTKTRPGWFLSWTTLANDSCTLLTNVQGKMNGLVPNWTNSSGTIPSGTDGQYGYDASRTPWRIATDYAWNGEARAVTFLDNVAKYIDASANMGIQRLFTPNSALQYRLRGRERERELSLALR